MIQRNVNTFSICVYIFAYVPCWAISYPYKESDSEKTTEKKHEMQKSYLPWQISYLCNLYDVKKRFLYVIKKFNNYQIWILKKKYIKSTRNWVLRANLQRPFFTMQCLTREMVKHVTVMDTVVFTATDHTTHVQYCTVKMPDLSCDFHVMWLSEYNILHSTELLIRTFFPINSLVTLNIY